MLRCSNIYRRVVEHVAKEQYRVSRLSNGLRVITCDDSTGIAGLGLFTLNGAKFESEGTYGAAAVFESLPLRSNQLMTTPQISETLGMLGNAIRVINNKEALGVLLMTPAYHCEEGLRLLNAMALHPTQSEEEFLLAKEKALERSLLSTRDGMSMCLEMLHDAGWSGRGLGHPLNPSAESLNKLSLESFTAFFKTFTTPSRCVVAATGIEDHDTFVRQAEAILQFDFVTGSANEIEEKTVEKDDSSDVSGGISSSSSGSFTPRSSSTPLLLNNVQTPLQGIIDSAPYTGGVRTLENTAAPESMNKFQEKNLSHLALFFKGIPLHHPDYYTVSVMQTLLGGGTSFSSGGPGKGMHTKIYREVLTRESGVHGLECITAWYSDGGLIGLYGAVVHERVDRMLEVMLHQSLTISDRISEHHLQMAKNQMCSQLILLGETRDQLLSDMGLNLLVHNYAITPQETAEGTSRVTMEDLRRVSKEVVASPPALAVYGSTKSVPSFDVLRERLNQK